MDILVACDGSDLQTRLQSFFRHGGSPSDEVDYRTRDDALKSLERRHPEIVLLAIDAPSVDDLDFLRKLLPRVPASQVLVIGPATDPKFILQAVKHGNVRYVDITELDSELPNVLLECRTHFHDAGKGRLISILGLSGGCGATTLAVSAAAEYSRRHGTSALIDLDLEHGDAAPLLNVRPIHTVADFCRNLSRMDDIMFKQCFVRHSSGAHLMAAPLKYRDIGFVTPDGVEKLLELARRRYPVTFADLHSCYRPDQAPALHHADLILCVIRHDFTSLHHASRTLGYLEDLGIPDSRVAFVTGKILQTAELGLKEVEEALKLKVYSSIPDDQKNVNWATNHGAPVVLSRPNSPAARAIKSMLNRIESIL